MSPAYALSEPPEFEPAPDGTAILEPLESSWRRVELDAYLDGSYEPPKATLLRRTDGAGLAYAGRVHWLSGEPEALKSWLALLMAQQVITAGGRVVYIDLEDSPAGIAGRLLALGLTPEQIRAQFAYLAPDGPLRHTARDQLAPLIEGADLVVIDACTEALAAQGLSSKDDVDIASWLSLLPRWAAKLGPAVFVLDHVTKDSETRGRWASGSGHKLAGLDGVAFTLEAVQPGGIGMTGRSRLYVSKDRHGQVRPHSVPSAGGKAWLADFVVDSTGPFTDAALHAPAVHEGPFVPTVVMGKVSDVLAASGREMSKREIEDRVNGKAAVIRQALAALVDRGHVEVTNGHHNSQLHRLVRSYPDSEADQ